MNSTTHVFYEISRYMHLLKLTDRTMDVLRTLFKYLLLVNILSPPTPTPTVCSVCFMLPGISLCVAAWRGATAGNIALPHTRVLQKYCQNSANRPGGGGGHNGVSGIYH
jgi:hypothetical protein